MFVFVFFTALLDTLLVFEVLFLDELVFVAPTSAPIFALVFVKYAYDYDR